MTIHVVDTSVLLNVLDVPGRNQQRQEVIRHLKNFASGNDQLLLPFVAVVEAGRHIAHLNDGSQRRQFASALMRHLRQALDGEAPWSPIAFPGRLEVESWIASFPESAMRGVSLADHAMLAEFERTCDRHQGHRVRIWSYDEHLQGRDRQPVL